MALTRYLRAAPFSDGDVLGASMANAIVRNQQWLREVTEPVAMPRQRNFYKSYGTTLYFVIVHGGRSDNLHFNGTLTADTGPATLSLYYKDMNNPLWTETCTSGTLSIDRTDSIFSWPSAATHPASGDVVRVKLVLGGNGTPYFTMHYLREQVPITSIQYRKASGSFTDGTTAEAKEVNVLVRNDTELSALASPVVGFRETLFRINQGEADAMQRYWVRHGGDSDKLRAIGWYSYDPPASGYTRLCIWYGALQDANIVMRLPDDALGGSPCRKFTQKEWFDVVKPLPAGHGLAGQERTITIWKDPSISHAGILEVHFLYIGEER